MKLHDWKFFAKLRDVDAKDKMIPKPILVLVQFYAVFGAVIYVVFAKLVLVMYWVSQKIVGTGCL